jgi:hypothetical protein
MVNPTYYAKASQVTPSIIECHKKETGKVTQDDKLCKICYMKNANTIVNNCGHAGMCSECAVNVLASFPTCMMCRGTIDKVLVIKRVDAKQVEILEVLHPEKIREN